MRSRSHRIEEWAVIVAILASCALGGCREDAVSSAPPDSVLEASRDTDGGTFGVSLTLGSSSVPLNRHFTVEVEILEGGDPVGDDVTAVIDADMPEHKHGMNTAPVIERHGPGSYRAEGMLFHMPGNWELYVDVRRGGKTERAVFRFNVK